MSRPVLRAGGAARAPAAQGGGPASRVRRVRRATGLPAASAARRTARRAALRAAHRRPHPPHQDVSRETFVLAPLWRSPAPDGRDASRTPQASSRRRTGEKPPDSGVSPPRAAQNASSNRHDARKGFPARLRPDRKHPSRVISCGTEREERMRLVGHCAPMRPSRRGSVQFSPRCCSSAASKTRSRARGARRPGETSAIGKAGEPGEPACVTFR